MFFYSKSTLQVNAILPFPHSNIKISCPLTFGTEPLTITGPSATAHINEASPFLQNVSEQDVGSSAGLKQPSGKLFLLITAATYFLNNP